jgi:hypothetical protein
VIVEYPLDEKNGVGDALEEFMSASVYDRGSEGKMSILRRLENRRRFIDWMGIHPLPMPARVYTGHADPQDASHFTIEFQWPDGDRGILDGKLRDDDRVELTFRPGPGDVESERGKLYPPQAHLWSALDRPTGDLIAPSPALPP